MIASRHDGRAIAKEDRAIGFRHRQAECLRGALSGGPAPSLKTQWSASLIAMTGNLVVKEPRRLRARRECTERQLREASRIWPRDPTFPLPAPHSCLETQRCIR